MHTYTSEHSEEKSEEIYLSVPQPKYESGRSHQTEDIFEEVIIDEHKRNEYTKSHPDMGRKSVFPPVLISNTA